MSIFNLKNEYDIPKFKDYVNKLFRERAVVEVKKSCLTALLPRTVTCIFF